MADPDGHEFCVLTGEDSVVASAARAGGKL
jgi:hypothetical protein